MHEESRRSDWTDFLGGSRATGNLRELGAANAGKTVLLTGAGGCIGAALAQALVRSGARRLILLDSSEHALYKIDRDLAAVSDVEPPASILGDSGDAALLDDIFRTFQPEMIYHAAAFKHVPLMEFNPLAAIRNNAIGTYVLAQAAAKFGASKLIMISTDKAVNPTSVMGASKRIAEMALMALSTQKTLMIALRLGNVLGSPGSVAPLFTEQIARGGPVTITHPEATRYFLTIGDCIHHILRAASHKDGPCILLPKLGRPLKITNLARYLMRRAGREVPVTFTGLRAGEKLREQLVATGELKRACRDCGLFAVRGRTPPAADLRFLVRQMQKGVNERGLPQLLRTLHCVVAGYHMSGQLKRAALDRAES